MRREYRRLCHVWVQEWREIMRELGTRELCCVWSVIFGAEFVVVEHEGWTHIIDQALWSSAWTRKSNLPVGLFKNQIQKSSLLVPVQD